MGKSNSKLTAEAMEKLKQDTYCKSPTSNLAPPPLSLSLDSVCGTRWGTARADIFFSPVGLERRRKLARRVGSAPKARAY